MRSPFLSNLFGTIAEGAGLTRLPSNLSFIPLDSNGNVLQIKGDQATWLGLQNRMMQFWAYLYCSPFAAVVDRLAEADINGRPEILRKEGKGKDNFANNEFSKRMNSLMRRPNPLQGWEDFRGQQLVYKRIFGFCPVLPIVPAGYREKSQAYQMWNLPPWLFGVRGKRKLLRQKDTSGMIDKYTLDILGETIEMDPSDVFIVTDSFMQDENYDFLLPKSRLVGLDMSISNICAALEADNVLLRKKGPLGFLSHDAAATKDSVAGYLPMTPTQKEELQADLAQYGMSLHQWQYVISRQAMRWNPISFDVRELGTKETYQQGIEAICQRYNYSEVLLKNSDAKFANGNQASKDLYQNNVIPNRERDDSRYEEFFLFDENNCKLEANFDHLPVLQEDKKSEADALKAQTEALLLQYKNDIITKNQMLEALGQEKVGADLEGDLYYSQTVAGAAAVAEANKIIKDGPPKNKAA